MSEANINITLSTTGSGQAATDVQKVGTKVEQLGKQTATTSGQTKNWGMATNAMSYQMQDFAVQVGSGTSALTAFAQQAPQLIGGLSMAGVMTGGVSIAMSALAVAIPIALFGGKALWSSFSGGAEDAKKKTEALNTRLKESTKIYQEFEDAGKKARDDEAAAAERLRRQMSGLDIDFKIRGDATALQGTIATLTAQLELSRQRLDLARIESALTVATGEDVLRLTKEREAVVQRIYDAELNIQQVARETALEKARDAKDQAQAAFDIQKEKYDRDFQALEAQKRLVEDLTATANKLQQDRRTFTALLQADQDAKKKQVADMGPAVNPNSPAGFLKNQLEGEIKDLAKLIKQAGTAHQEEITDTIAQANVQAKVLDDMSAKFESSKEKIEGFAAALTKATIAISNTKRTQAAEEKIGGEIKATDEIAKTGKTVTEAAKKAIEAIKNEASKTGENVTPRRGFPGQETPKSGAISAIEDLLKDATPDAEQGARLVEILRNLQNGLSQKDAVLTTSIEALLTITNGQVDACKALKTRVEALESKANQSR